MLQVKIESFKEILEYLLNKCKINATYYHLNGVYYNRNYLIYKTCSTDNFYDTCSLILSRINKYVLLKRFLIFQ